MVPSQFSLQMLLISWLLASSMNSFPAECDGAAVIVGTTNSCCVLGCTCSGRALEQPKPVHSAEEGQNGGCKPMPLTQVWREELPLVEAGLLASLPAPLSLSLSPSVLFQSPRASCSPCSPSSSLLSRLLPISSFWHPGTEQHHWADQR